MKEMHHTATCLLLPAVPVGWGGEPRLVSSDKNSLIIEIKVKYNIRGMMIIIMKNP